MLRPLSVAVLVSLISVEVSCNLLEELEDNQVSSMNQQTRPPQSREQTEFSNQPTDSVSAVGRNFPGYGGPSPKGNPFSVGLSRENVEAPTRLPEPSSRGCAKQDHLNFPGSPSMVFNPGAHVNSVIGVPQDYKIDISDGPDAWKIITIIAPKGSGAVSFEPNLGLIPQVGLSPTVVRKISSFPAGLHGLPSSQFPFLTRLRLGSPAGSLAPDPRILMKPGGPPDQQLEGFPGPQIPGRGIDRHMGVSGSYPDGRFLYDPHSFSGPLKPVYHSPGLQSPEIESFLRSIGLLGSDPRGQYQLGIPNTSGSPVQGYDQPGSQIPGMRGFSRPSGQPQMYPDSHYSDNLNPLPGIQTTQADSYPDGQYPDNANLLGMHPGSQTSGMGISPRQQEPSEKRYPDDRHSPPRTMPVGYNDPAPQSPGMERLSRPNQPSDRYPDGQQSNDTSSPSGPQFQISKPGSQMPSETGRFSSPSGQSGSNPDGQIPKNRHPESLTPEMGRPQQSSEGYPVEPNYLIIPRSSTPGSQIPPSSRDPFSSYPYGVRPDDTVSRLRPGFPSLPSTQETFPQPSGQQERYTDGQYPDDISSLPGPQTLRMGTSPSQHGQPDGQYPDVQRGPSGTPELINPASHTPGFRESPPHSGEQDTYQHGPSAHSRFLTPEYTPAPVTPGLGVSSLSGQPESYPTGQSPNDRISPSSSPFPRFNQPGLLKPETDSYDQHQGPYGPLGSRYGKPVSPAPEIGRYSNPMYEDYPGSQSPDGNRPHPESPVPGHSIVVSSRPWQTGRYPDGNYPHISSSPQGSLPEMEISGGVSTKIFPSVQYPDDVGGLIRTVGPGTKPGGFLPGTKEFLQPSGPSERYPDSFTRLSGHYTHDVGGVIYSFGPEHNPRHLLPMMEFGQPSEPFQRDPGGMLPDSVSYTPTHQSSSPRSQPVLIPGIERFPRPSGQYPDDQTQARQEILIVQSEKGLSPENMDMSPQFFPQRYKTDFQIPGVAESPGQIMLLNQGDVRFPEYLRYLLNPFLEQGKNMPSFSLSEMGRFPKPSVSQAGYVNNQYPEGLYPDNINNHPGDTAPEFTQKGSKIPSEGSFVNPIVPLDRFPPGQHNEGMMSLPSRYNILPGYQTIPQGAHKPNSRGSSINTVDFLRAPQGQDSIDVAYVELPPTNAPHPGSPDYYGSVRERSPAELGSTNTINPGDVRTGQDGSPSGRLTPYPSSSYAPEGGHHSPENHNSTDSSSPRGTMASEPSSSMGQISTYGQSHPQSGPNDEVSPGRNANPQSSPVHVILREGSGPGYEGSDLSTGPQHWQTRLVSMDSPEVGQIRMITGDPQTTGDGLQPNSVHHLSPSSSSMVIQYPHSSSGQSLGPDGSTRMIPSFSTQIYSSGSPQSRVVQSTTYQTAPPVTTTYYGSLQPIVPDSQSGGSRDHPSTLPGGNTYYSTPSTSFKTFYPGKVQSGGQTTYSSPSIQYQQPHQTMISRWPVSSSESAPSHHPTDETVKGVRSLDTE